MGAFYQTKSHDVGTVFMGLVAKNIEAKPLNGVKNKQNDQKEKIINNRYGIQKKFLHSF
jgi:hypothetical protein